ncbi:ABC transporter substrate-binding protein [Alteromonas sp. C1M14]|uniref:ABC transporter substrate-binding protein n=1 Tax=Alteromonas sp. C1M14 TaxID=2841567 RepID=UPI001C088369|nr:ABC transporter substrate-binding protein [Alteromonas sp. C1M14]MBU2979274.1 extracellular solute-binding protein [Alteromonas sp. C1M14]
MQRRTFIQGLAVSGLVSGFSLPGSMAFAQTTKAVSVNDLPELDGDLTLYLGRGEGGLYENVLEAIKKRNPKLNLQIRRGATAALGNTLIAEAKAGVRKADLFWAVDTGAIGMITDAGLAKPLPQGLTAQLKAGFQYPQWSPVTGRIRTLPYNTERVSPNQIPDSIMALADSDLALGWAPAYASFQSFVTAMRLLEGEKATADWLRGVNRHAKKYAGELGVVMGVERGEVDLGFANHYYTLRLKSGKPDASVELAYTSDDAGCLVNASGIVALSEGDLPINFIRYLLSKEVQSYLASEAYEIPLVEGVSPPAGLTSLNDISPPELDLRKLADIRPTLDLMRNVGIL